MAYFHPRQSFSYFMSEVTQYKIGIVFTEILFSQHINQLLGVLNMPSNLK